MKNTTEIKNTLEGIKSRLTLEGKWVNELEDRVMEITATEQNFFFFFKNEIIIVSETSGTALNAPKFTW